LFLLEMRQICAVFCYGNSISIEDPSNYFLFFVLKQRKETKENSRPIRCGTFLYLETSSDELAIANIKFIGKF